MLIQYDKPMIDYVTLTSYSFGLIKEASRLMRMELGPTKETKVVMYDGDIMQFEKGSLFAGTGQQGEREHHLVSIAGRLADGLAFNFLPYASGQYEGNCSRLDLQITIKSILHLEDMGKAMTGKTQRQVMYMTTLQGKRPGSTLYIGSPASDKRVRVYHKEGTRFEVQYRRDYAYDAMAKIESHGRSHRRVPIAQILLGEVRGLAKIEPIMTLFEGVLTRWASSEYVPKSNGRYQGDTEKWLRTSAIPCLIKECMVNPSLKSYIERLLRECDK